MLLVLGLVMLVAAFGFLLKIGMWVWIASHLSHNYEPPPDLSDGPDSGLDAMKKTLGVIAAAIGVITATVGLVKECTPDTGRASPYQQPAPQQPAYQQPAYQQPATQQPAYQQPVQQDVYSTTCCSTAGNCMMMDGAQPVGGECFCFDMLGQMATGTVCQ